MASRAYLISLPDDIIPKLQLSPAVRRCEIVPQTSGLVSTGVKSTRADDFEDSELAAPLACMRGVGARSSRRFEASRASLQGTMRPSA
jgi:hypothetical protein